MMKLLFFYVLGSHFYQFGLFMVKVQIWKIFLGLLNLKYFFWICLIFLIFLGIKSRSWVQAYVFGKNTPLTPELLDNLAKQAYKNQKSKEPIQRDRQPVASGQISMQADRRLDYAAHSLQNIRQALQPPELLDTCKLV